jgi:hypothetical protein
MTGIFLATRERVARALDVDQTAYRGPQIDQALDAATRDICGALHWTNIHPVVATRYFDWPNQQHARPYRLWLEDNPLISATTVTSGSVVIADPDRFLEPVNTGPPFTRLEIDLASAASFNSGDTHQRSLGILGLWGLGNDEVPAGQLAAAVVSTTSTVMDVSDGSRVGVGSLLRIDSERVNVTDRAWIDSTFNLAGDVAADDSATLIAVSGGTFFAGESIILGAEEMPIKAVTGAGLVVERAGNGTVLAAHTGAVDIYVNRRLTVERAAAGTTAATHLNAAPVVAWDPPALLESLAVAVAMDQVEQELGAYSRQIRSGDAAAEATGGGNTGTGLAASGLAGKWARAIRAHGRIRTGAI